LPSGDRPLALADEQLNAEVGLELADAGGHIRLDAVEFFGRPRDAAGLHDRAENLQIAEVAVLFSR
jgi:hypothetical protein